MSKRKINQTRRIKSKKATNPETGKKDIIQKRTRPILLEGIAGNRDAGGLVATTLLDLDEKSSSGMEASLNIRGAFAWLREEEIRLKQL